MEGEAGCRVVETSTRAVHTSAEFSVLVSDNANIFVTSSYCLLCTVQVGDDRRARLKYLGTRLSSAQLRAGGGVPCSLAQGEADCFLGAGVYSDGGW